MAAGSVVNVFVTTLSGERESLTVDPEITVDELKSLVRQKVDVPKQFRLGYKSRALAVKQTLAGAGVPNAAEIWMAKAETPVLQQSGHTQALGRVARGKQPNGSTLHAIAAVGTELQRTMNARADRIDAKIDANLVATTEVLSRINGEEVPRVPGQTDIARMKQLRSTKHNADQELTDIKERERVRKLQNKKVDNDTILQGAAIADGAVQSAFQDITSLEDLEKKRKAMNKAYAAQKKRMRQAAEGPPAAKKKPCKGSKAAEQTTLVETTELAAGHATTAEAADETSGAAAPDDMHGKA